MRKAFAVTFEFTVPIHAETRGQAKAIAVRVWPEDTCFTELHVTRIPKLDHLPFTTENVIDASVFAEPSDETREFYHNFCPCDMCKEAR